MHEAAVFDVRARQIVPPLLVVNESLEWLHLNHRLEPSHHSDLRVSARPRLLLRNLRNIEKQSARHARRCP